MSLRDWLFRPKSRKQSPQNDNPAQPAVAPNGKPCHESLSLERIINVVAIVAGLPRDDADTKWLKQSAGQEIFAAANPTLAKAVFSDSRITFQAGCAITDPTNAPLTDLLQAATKMLDSPSEVGIVAQSGESVAMMPSGRQIKLFTLIAISFRSDVRPLPVVVTSLSTPLTPGQMIRVG